MARYGRKGPGGSLGGSSGTPAQVHGLGMAWAAAPRQALTASHGQPDVSNGGAPWGGACAYAAADVGERHAGVLPLQRRSLRRHGRGRLLRRRHGGLLRRHGCGRCHHHHLRHPPVQLLAGTQVQQHICSQAARRMSELERAERRHIAQGGRVAATGRQESARLSAGPVRSSRAPKLRCMLALDRCVLACCNTAQFAAAFQRRAAGAPPPVCMAARLQASTSFRNHCNRRTRPQRAGRREVCSLWLTKETCDMSSPKPISGQASYLRGAGSRK